jgi:cell division protein FtsB
MTPSDVWTRRLASAWLFWPVCLAGVFLLGLGLLGPEAERRLGVEAQCAAMQSEVDSLRQVRDELAAKEQALQNDPQYIERVVRGNLRLTKPGEIALPQPAPLAPAKKPEAAAAGPLLPPVMESLARYGDPWMRLAAMVSGVALLGAAMVLSLPGRQSAPQA